MNGTYIHFWQREIREQVEGQYIDDIRIRERLVQIVFTRLSLYISLYPDVMALCVDRKDDRDYKSLSAFRTLVHGLRVGYMEQDSFKPVLRMGLRPGDDRESEEIILTIVLYREAPNIVVSKGNAYRKIFSRFVDKKARQSLWAARRDRIAELFTGDRDQVERTVLTTYEGIDQNLIKELTPTRAQRVRDFMDGQGSMRPRLVSVKPLKISLFAKEYIKEYESFNALLQDVITAHSEMRCREQREAEKKRAIHILQRRIERLKKKVLALEEVERYRLIGTCLLANLASITRGDERVVLPALSGHGTYEIRLDPSKSPQENAQAYFTRYKKAKRGQPQMQEKIARLQQELVRIHTETWESKEKKSGGKTKPENAASPFRLFHLDSGADIYVGKNARSNIELTFSFANPHDYFFHARGYQGSHVILRARTKKGQKAAKKDIETAAAIAAFYSKAKKQKRVPVSYTQRKYLKKNKKGKPGAVILMREEVVFVDPILPSSNSKS
jgi:predicted ribosome quality control (RQC) complex YloA/Tae2 family protein